jgi:hypothetical protein
MKIIRPTISLLCLLLLAVSLAFAQLTGGSMTGTVTDANGGVVAKAKVIATHVASGRVSEPQPPVKVCMYCPVWKSALTMW